MIPPSVPAMDDSDSTDVFVEASVVTVFVCFFAVAAVCRSQRKPFKKVFSFEATAKQEHQRSVLYRAVHLIVTEIGNRIYTVTAILRQIVAQQAPDSKEAEPENAEELLRGLDVIDDTMNELMDKHLENLAAAADMTIGSDDVSSEELVHGLDVIDVTLNELMNKHLESLALEAEEDDGASEAASEELVRGFDVIDATIAGLMTRHLESLAAEAEDDGASDAVSEEVIQEFDAVGEAISDTDSPAAEAEDDVALDNAANKEDTEELVTGLKIIDQVMGGLLSKHMQQLEADDRLKHSPSSSTVAGEDDDVDSDEEELLSGLTVIDGAMDDLMSRHLTALAHQAAT